MIPPKKWDIKIEILPVDIEEMVFKFHQPIKYQYDKVIKEFNRSKIKENIKFREFARFYQKFSIIYERCCDVFYNINHWDSNEWELLRELKTEEQKLLNILNAFRFSHKLLKENFKTTGAYYFLTPSQFIR